MVEQKSDDLLEFAKLRTVSAAFLIVHLLLNRCQLDIKYQKSPIPKAFPSGSIPFIGLYPFLL